MAAMPDVLVTRPSPGGEQTAEALDRCGYRAIVAPVLEIVPVPGPLPEADRLQAILVTSGQALPALAAAHRGVRLLTVGDATAARARQAGHSQVDSADGDAQALARLAAACCTPARGPLLLASGEGQGGALAQVLRAAGYDVLHRVVYAARPVTTLPAAARAALLSRTLYAATFFSAETARIFAGLAVSAGLRDTVAPVVALAIGGQAAAALADLPWRCVRVAVRPTQDELLALL